MNRFRGALKIYSTLLIIVAGCIEEYPPPVANEEIDYLVVDGTIDGVNGSATVRLSKAIPLASTEIPPVELNALVSVEDSEGNIFPLAQQNDEYSVSNLPIDFNRQYRINIRRSDGRQYQSEFISVKQTPEIDELTWRVTPARDGFEILVSTQDNSGQSRYYLWTYDETYEYTAFYNSLFKYENGEVVPKPQEESVYRCWQTLPSRRIIIGSSENLNQDIINELPLLFIPVGSVRMIIKYSINVKQRVLSQEAYEYWRNLQATTENLGGLFDPQPGSVTGNVHNVGDLNEPVLGYFDAGEIKEKRLFINSNELPSDMRSYSPFGYCQLDSVTLDEAPKVAELGYAYVSAIQPLLEIIGYEYSTQFCTDCRLQGGTVTRPSFWE